MRNHYLPRFLLRGFTDQSGLWQFDINTGAFERRSVENAGQRRHFYSAELERGLLQRVDGNASQVFTKGLVDQSGRVLVTPDDRVTLAHWLALFAMRTPEVFENFNRYVEEAANDPQPAVDIIYENKTHVLQIAQESSPEAYKLMIEEFGRYAGEALMLAAFASAVRQGRVNYLFDPKTAFVAYIEAERMEKFAARLLRFQWVWLVSEYGFIIGDNPLCRWNRRTGNWNYGLNYRDVEVTIPLSQRVCLRLQRRQCRDERALYCNRELTRVYNRRQMISSVYNVYGPERRLRPMAAKVVRTALQVGKLASPPRHAP